MQDKNNLPLTPAETVKISSDSLRSELSTVVTLATKYGFWKAPYKEAATTFEEMDMMDIYYWVYKSANPIAEPEEGVKELLSTDSSIVGLPKDFEKKESITMGTAGDLLQVQTDNLEYSEDELFESVADLIFDKDIAFANFESPITTQPLVKEVIGDEAAPIECCSEEQFEVLKGYKGKKFTALNFSNNHTFDLGIEGMETTQKVFDKQGIIDIGTNRKPEEYGRAKIITKDGIKIGFASATFGLNGHVVPDEEKYRIHTARLCSKIVEPELDLVKKQIDDCKDQGCDFIITSLHWGWEFELFPRKSQMEAARTLIEYGADSIIGAHPHVIQPVEYYRTKRDSNRVAVIAYSMGSVTWGFNAAYIALSIILNLSFTKGKLEGKDVTYIESSNVTPVFRSCVNDGGKLKTRIERLADHLEGRSNLHTEEYIAELKSYLDLVLGDECDLSPSKKLEMVA